MNITTGLGALALVLLAGCSTPRAAEPPPPKLASPPVREFSEALWLPPVGMGGRTAIVLDPLAAALLRDPSHGFEEGEEVTAASGDRVRWRRIAAGEHGFAPEGAPSFNLQARMTSAERRILLLEAPGVRQVYVNGEQRAGDHYGTGMVRTPVQIIEGTNTFLFVGARAGIRPRLTEPPAPFFISDRDPLVPTPRHGVPMEDPGAAVVVNATEEWIRGARITAHFDGHEGVTTRLPDIGPLETRKVPFDLRAPAPAEDETTRTLHLELRRRGSTRPDHEWSLDLAVLDPGRTHKRTFRSAIDGSVQYYAVNPCTRPGPGKGLLLSLHGAAVEGLGQAASYAPKDFLHIVSPTNRRPFGFDWEDWGRLDAMEALGVARARLATDPLQTWVTGHSMGGHGTWQLATLFPGTFAAAAPSAGWLSFNTYSRNMPGADSKVTAMLRRASSTSDTPALFPNLRETALSILHGDADDNVPVTEAREAARILRSLGIPFGYHEQPGAGHWWDAERGNGADCVDWPAFMDMFRSARLVPPAERTRIDFRTFSPHASASHTWATILEQERPMEPSRVVAEVAPSRDSITATTENIAALRLAFDAIAPGATEVALQVDGQGPLRVPARAGAATLLRSSGRWRAVGDLARGAKRPDAQGPFKQLFTRNVLLVYGTAGSDAEDLANYARARLDAETFWIIGNASFEVVADTRLPRDWRRRNLVLYGNADTHRLWDSVFEDAAPRVTRHGVEIPGGPSFRGEDLACLFVHRGNGGLVGAVAWTGPAGGRLSSRLYYFGSGSGFPDYLVANSSLLTLGQAGILATGFFDNDWRFNPRDTAP